MPPDTVVAPVVADELADRFARIDAFAGLERADLHAIVAGAEIVELPVGETLVRQGDEADRIFVLLDGRLDVVVDDGAGNERALGDVSPGSVVGEIPVLVGGARTATLRAGEKSSIAVLSAQTFARLLEDSPEVARRLTEVAARRLRTAQLVSHLGKVFPTIDRGTLQELGRSVEWRMLSAGEVLFRQGDPGDAAYLVVSGRVRVAVADDESAESGDQHERVAGQDGVERAAGHAGGERVVGEIVAGELVGEQSILLDTTRSATVFAARDTNLARIPRDVFSKFVESHPGVMLPMIRTIVARSRSALLTPRRRLEERLSVALIPLGEDSVEALLENPLFEHLKTFGATVVLSAEHVDASLHRRGITESEADVPAHIRLLQWLDEVEEAHRFVFYRADREHPRWTERAIRQADHVVFFARARSDPSLREVESRIAALREHRAQCSSLVLWHEAGVKRPTGTARWLEVRNVDSVYHVRDGDTATFARLARILAGRAVGLVLGGGGARGFAHLGVMRVLEELGVPVDIIGGASIGASVSLPAVQGQRNDEATATCERYFQSLLDYTLPIVSLLAGKRISGVLMSFAGSWDIEDTWIPYFCVSTNITTARTMVHRRGNLARAARASVAIPGVLPPVPYGDDLLVDGGVLNNLPLDVMREINPTGPVIAVHVVPRKGPRARGDYGLSLSGWSLAASRIMPGGKRVHVPSVGVTMLRSMVVGAEDAVSKMLDDGLADLYLNINASAVGLLEFDTVRKVAQIGYEASLEPIRQWVAEGGVSSPRR